MGGSTSGNGEPYEGKPEPGEYYRAIPGYLCQGKSVIYSQMTVTDTEIAKQSVNPKDCTVDQQTLQISEVEAAAANPAMLGHLEGIYQKLATPPDPAKLDLVNESWCRLRRPTAKDISVVITNSLATGQSSASMHSASLDSAGALTMTPEVKLNVSRNLKNSNLDYQGDAFALHVDLQVPDATQVGKFAGTLKVNDTTYDMDCRTGAIMDQKAISLPRLAVDFSTSDLPNAVAFQRNASATYFDVTGLLRTAASGVPRFEFEPLSHKPLGLLLEPAATNLVGASEAFENPGWTALAGLQVAPKSALAPDGSNNAATLTDSNGGAVSYAFYEVTNPGASTIYTSSVFVKRGTSPGVSLITWFLNGATPVYSRVRLDWATLALSSFNSPPVASGVVAVGDGWYRLWIASANNNSGNPDVRIAIEPAGVFSTDTGTVYAWGAQLELGQFPSSYIPTSAGPVTRDDDVAKLTDLSWYNANEGTIHVQGSRANYEVTRIGSIRPTLFSFVNAGGTEVLSLYYDPLTFFHGLIQGSTGPATDWAQGAATAPAANQTQTLFLGYKPGDSTLFVNGIEAQAPSSVLTGVAPTELYLGGATTASRWLGHVMSLTYWPTRLDSQTINGLSQ